MKPVMHALAVASLVLPCSVFAAAPTAALTEGTVKAFDPAARRIKLAHGPIANVGMPAMTMTFKAGDAVLRQPPKPGDRVRFRVEQEGGEYTVVHIEAAPRP